MLSYYVHFALINNIVVVIYRERNVNYTSYLYLSQLIVVLFQVLRLKLHLFLYNYNITLCANTFSVEALNYPK